MNAEMKRQYMKECRLFLLAISCMIVAAILPFFLVIYAAFHFILFRGLPEFSMLGLQYYMDFIHAALLPIMAGWAVWSYILVNRYKKPKANGASMSVKGDREGGQCDPLTGCPAGIVLPTGK